MRGVEYVPNRSAENDQEVEHAGDEEGEKATIVACTNTSLFEECRKVSIQ